MRALSQAGRTNGCGSPCRMTDSSPKARCTCTGRRFGSVFLTTVSRRGHSDQPAALSLSFAPADALRAGRCAPVLDEYRTGTTSRRGVTRGPESTPRCRPRPTANKTVAEVAPIPASPVSEQTSLQQELQATKDVVVKQAQELQQLKAELESLRRQLTEKDPPPRRQDRKLLLAKLPLPLTPGSDDRHQTVFNRLLIMPKRPCQTEGLRVWLHPEEFLRHRQRLGRTAHQFMANPGMGGSVTPPKRSLPNESGIPRDRIAHDRPSCRIDGITHHEKNEATWSAGDNNRTRLFLFRPDMVPLSNRAPDAVVRSISLRKEVKAQRSPLATRPEARLSPKRGRPLGQCDCHGLEQNASRRTEW